MDGRQPASERVSRPDWVRRVDRIAESVGGGTRDLVPLDAASLLGQAPADLLLSPQGGKCFSRERKNSSIGVHPDPLNSL